MPTPFAPWWVLLFVPSLLVEELESAGTVHISPVTLRKEGAAGICPAKAKRDEARQTIANAVGSVLGINITESIGNPCGRGNWYQVVDLDMTNTSQECPSAWMQYVSTEVRACERIQNVNGGCESTFFPINHQYSKVCGRATGYQVGGSAAFGWTTQQTIDTYYLYGLSLTYGSPRMHIWTFATGISEGDQPRADWHCPCTDPTDPRNAEIPSFVGDNYFCESGNPTNTWIANHLYSGDPLWDGEQCANEGICCTNANSPPWFSVTLPNLTTDDIEARLCVPPNSAGEEVILQKLEIYVQ